MGGMASSAAGPGGNRIVLDDRIMTTRRGRGDVLRRRADPRGRVAGLPADRYAAHGHAGRTQPRARARGPTGDGAPAGDRAGGRATKTVSSCATGCTSASSSTSTVSTSSAATSSCATCSASTRRPVRSRSARQVEVGQTVQFQVRDADAADEDLRCLLAGVSAARARCCSRATAAGRTSSPSPDHDAAVVEELLGTGAAGRRVLRGRDRPDRRPQFPARLHRQRRRVRLTHRPQMRAGRRRLGR